MALDRSDLRQLQLFLRPLVQRVANTVARAVIHLADDGKKLQLLQLGVLAGETIDGAEHHQPYGFSSVPLGGAEAVVVFPNGDRARPLVVSVSDRRYRPTGGIGGEVCMYTDEGDTIRLGRGHIVSIETSGQVRLGSASASEAVVVESALGDFMAALAAAILALGASPAAPALAALQTALGNLNAHAGWKAGTTKTKAE